MITCARDLSIYVSSGSSSSKHYKFVPGGNARSGPVCDGLTDEVSNPKVVQSPPAYPEDSVLSDQSERQIDDETSGYAGPEFCKLLDDGHPLYHFKRQMQLNSLVLLLVQLDCSTKLDHLPQTNPHEPHHRLNTLRYGIGNAIHCNGIDTVSRKYDVMYILRVFITWCHGVR